MEGHKLKGTQRTHITWSHSPEDTGRLITISFLFRGRSETEAVVADDVLVAVVLEGEVGIGE